MIPDSFIEVAARWLAEQEWSPCDESSRLSREELIILRSQRSEVDLRIAIRRSDGQHIFAKSVTAKPRSDKEAFSVARVEVSEDGVQGFLDFNRPPAYIWPPISTAATPDPEGR